MTRYLSIKFLLIFTCGIFTTSTFYSQHISDSTHVKNIDEIILIGKKQDTEVIPYQKLSGKELENLNSTTVADAMRYFAGLQLKDYGGVGGMKTVNMRGMGSQHVGVFYDGIQLGNAQNGTVDLGRFSLDNMEAISLYNGQKSRIFQSAKDFSSAGTIYLETKIPKFEGEKKNNLSINYRSGSFKLVNPSILWEHKISENISSSLNFEYVNSDGKYKFRYRKDAWDSTAIRQNSNISAFRAEAGVFGNINQGKWKLKGYYYDSDRQVPSAIIKNSFGRYQFEKQWDRNFFVQGSLEKQITPKYKILINTKYAYDYLHYLNHEQHQDIVSRHVDNTYKQQEFYISTAQQYSLFHFWDMALSADYQYNIMDANLDEFASPKRNMELIALATNLRFHRFKFQASILGTFVQEQTKENTTRSSPDKSEYTPSVFFNYQPFRNPDLSIHTFYKRIFRMPTFNDLYYTEIGNSQLEPEYTSQYDIGINYNKDFTSGVLKNINLVVDAYYNEVTNKIVAYPSGQHFRWSMMNFGKVRIRGVDVSAQSSWLINRDLLLNIKTTYTYEDAQNLTVDSDNDTRYYKDQIPYIPWHSGSILVGLVYKSWNLNYSFIYAGERYVRPANIPENYSKSFGNHDISLTKEIMLRECKLKASVEINNLFDKQYSVVEGYPLPLRSYRISLRLNL